MGLNFPQIFIPTIVALTSLLLLALGFALWRRHRYARLPATDPEALLRLKEKSNVAEGAQVWFSRRVHRGAWQHWSLIIRDTRYELRQNTKDPSAAPLLLRVEPCNLMQERKQAQADTSFLPSYRGFYVTLVGWTRRSDRELKAVAERALRAAAAAVVPSAAGPTVPHASIHIQPPTPFTPASRPRPALALAPPLTPVWEKSMEGEIARSGAVGEAEGQAQTQTQAPAQMAGMYEHACQEFLRLLADEVCEERKAADWGWFRDNVTSYWRDVEVRLMAGPMDKEGGVRPRSQLPVFSSVDAGVRAWAYNG